MLTQYMRDIVHNATGEVPTSLQPLRASSDQAALYHVHCQSGAQFALKTGARLEVEARGLHRLAYEGLPSPHVHAQSENYILMDWIIGNAHMPGPADADLGETLARLHRVRGTSFGWEETTYVGGLPYDNTPCHTWIEFFRDQRLLAEAEKATREGQLPAPYMPRIEALAAQLPSLLPSDPEPRLCHGDLWSGNILCTRRRVAALIDPALYYGIPEMDLARFALLGQPGAEFYDSYRELHGELVPDYRMHEALYQLIPLLILVRQYGGSYLGQVNQRLVQLGL